MRTACPAGDAGGRLGPGGGDRLLGRQDRRLEGDGGIRGLEGRGDGAGEVDRERVRRHGITSNALAPSLIDTPMLAGIADLASRIPVGRLGRPQDVADLVTFLASEHAGYITGEVVDVNGGFLID